MLMCIDGSGPDDDAEYARAFRHSFLQQMVQSTTQARHQYYRGPNAAGLHQVDLASVARRSRELHEADVAAGGTPKVYLAGYSRGAAGVVHVAYLLQSWEIQVDAMFLFDAVDRSPLIGDTLPAGNVDVVPSNVVSVHHARRHPDAESRESFENTALSAARAGGYAERLFLTTHGGMGGTPWGLSGLSPADRAAYESHDPARRRHALRDAYIDEGLSEAAAGTLSFDPSDGVTTITLDQEEAGAQAVIDWMWPKMVRLGAVREGSTPYVMTRLRAFGESLSSRPALGITLAPAR